MKHNIVAEFSTSIWKESEAERAASLGFSVGDFKVYPVVNGSVFNDEFNETLDSATIVLSQVKKEDRLSNINPYDFVRIYDTSSYDEQTQKYDFDKVLLLDNYSEQENNIKEHIFGYTIGLMSETKLLEKIQCPNLAITHKVDSNGHVVKKTIWQHIKQYMELYVPKIKFSSGSTWSYEPLINFPISTASSNITKTFNSDNFVQVGSNMYQLLIYTASLPVGIDISTVTLKKYTVVTSGLNIIEGPVINIDRDNRRFSIYLRSSNTGHGTFDIFYDYQDYEHEFYKKFNVPCADMGFSNPTLRQLLTTLMLQVGCIPTVENRTLGFLDFQAQAHDFGGEKGYDINNTVNFIKRSLSSDSYVNQLINTSNQVLDSENEVICETLGFRDKSKVLLKQQENLTLETKLPIYKVNKFVVNFFADVYLKYPQLNTLFDPKNYRTNVNSGLDYYFQFQTTEAVPNGFAILHDSGGDYLRMAIDCTNAHVYMSNAEFYPLKRNSDDGSYSYYEDAYGHEIKTIASLTSSPINPKGPNPNHHGIFASIRFDGLTSFDAVYMVCENVQLSYWNAGTASWNTITFKCVNATFTIGGEKRVMFLQQDITKLLVEQSQRALLNNDFVAMTNANITSIDQLAQYLYGTVGYNIGSNKISGFSDTYEVGSGTVVGWITKGYTYIENIINFIVKRTMIEPDKYQSMVDFYKVPVLIDNNVDLNGYTQNNIMMNQDLSSWYHPTNVVNYATLFFDIYYQPLNSFNLAYTKTVEQIDYPLQQYDSNDSGLTDFDRLSLHEQEQVDRVGNETLSINQRTSDFDDIQNFKNGPLVFKDDTNRSGSIGPEDKGIKYIIFKRSFTINNNCYNATYIGSKDAVLKDYFTSIRTKYRAYQYVDYNSSVLRKERDNIFVRIGEDWYDGDDKIWFGNWSAASQNKRILGAYQFVYNLDSTSNITNKITYVAEKGLNSKGRNENAKNDVSVIVNRNTLALIYESPDNVGNGTYITNANYDTSYVFQNGGEEEEEEKYKIGGVPQAWQIWDEDTFNSKHPVIFLYDIDFYNNDYYSNIGSIINSTSAAAKTVANNILRRAALSPIVEGSLINTSSGTNFALCVVDTNQNRNSLTRTFYKDYAERINHTVEFTYYSATPNFKWTEYFIEFSPFVSRMPNISEIAMYGSNTFEDLNHNAHNVPSNTDTPISSGSFSDYIQIIHDENIGPVSKIVVNFHDYHCIKVCLKQSNGQVSDIMSFRRKSDTENVSEFYITLNDTKTDYVLAEKNGILYRGYVVSKNTLSRTVENSPDIYDEEE